MGDCCMGPYKKIRQSTASKTTSSAVLNKCFPGKKGGFFG
jgi:hypothetical protein